MGAATGVKGDQGDRGRREAKETPGPQPCPSDTAAQGM